LDHLSSIFNERHFRNNLIKANLVNDTFGMNYNYNNLPEGISYQTLLRKSNGQIMSNTDVTLQFSIHMDSAVGYIEYQEIHIVTTNNKGIVNTKIGKGAPSKGNFSNINWGNAIKFLQVKLMAVDGSFDLGTQQLMAVPYALYAANSPIGKKGEIGDQGIAGIQGLKGDSGIQGFQGVAGMQGQQGLKGNGFINGTNAGEMIYWNGNNWISITPGLYGQLLSYCNGMPVWGGGSCISSATFVVSVNQGYGSGQYHVGDTVHIWSNNANSNETFNYWSGDIANITGKNEWHTWFVMPPKNIQFVANFKSVNNVLQYESIRGKNNFKKVYYSFPVNHKGIVYLFHGSNGSASNWVVNQENVALVQDLLADGFAVIITEAEEVTLNSDINADGSLRWNTTTMDSISNIDFANIKAITDTFYSRGNSNRSIPKFTIGQSNGGSFSISFGSYFNMKASVAYCSSGGGTSGVAVNTSITPILFCLQGADNNSIMGQQGNSNAITNSLALNARSICSKYYVNIPSPLYENRFARNSIISNTLSAQIFNEIKNNHLLNSRNYFLGYADNLWNSVSASSSNFPIINSLSTTQKNAIDEQISSITADHQFYSDHNKATILFLNSQCQ